MDAEYFSCIAVIPINMHPEDVEFDIKYFITFVTKSSFLCNLFIRSACCCCLIFSVFSCSLKEFLSV